MVTWVWVLIPIFGILAGMLGIWTEHRRKMAMIKQGMNPEEQAQQAKGRYPENMLVGGMVVLGIGIAFLVAQTIGGLTSYILLPGFVLLFIGIALTTSYLILRRQKKS